MTDKSDHATDRIYVLVCNGESCSQKGNADKIRVALKQAARNFPAKSVKVSFVSCLGLCGEGPNVVVFSGGRVFSRRLAHGVDDIVELVGEELARHRT